MADNQIQLPSGICCVTTYGSIQQETVGCLLEMRSYMEKQGVHNIQWPMVPGGLVDKARNDAVRTMLRAGAGWLCFVDGDCQFAPETLLNLLKTAYGSNPECDIIGAWNPLRGDLALPTIDTGTGTWESVYPGSGLVEVMRTGAAFLLIKRHVFERIPDPWFALRVPARPIDFMAEIDNYSRMKFDGQNVFRNLPGQPWEKLEALAQQDPSSNGQWTPAEVGEDSGFSDKAKMMGFRIFVHTDIVCGHVDKHSITWETHKKAVENMALQQRQVVGVLV